MPLLPRLRDAFRFLLPTVILFAVLPHEKPASAALVISFQENATIIAGSSGFIDVLISSTDSDSVDLVNYEFAITNVGSPTGTLQFAAQDFSEHGFGNYVFASDPSVDGIIEYSLTNSVLEAGDFTENFSGVPLTPSTQLLLARLELEHVLGPGQTAALAVGEQFLITLQPGAGTFFQDEFGTEFSYDQLNNPSPLSLAAASFDSGTITVTAGATAVPEPSSLLLLAASGVGLMARKRRQNLLAGNLSQAS